MVHTKFSFLLFGDKEVIKKTIDEIWNNENGLTFKKQSQKTTPQTMTIFDDAVLFDIEFDVSIKIKKIMEKYSLKNKLSMYYSAIIEDGPFFHYWFDDRISNSEFSVMLTTGNTKFSEKDFSDFGVNSIYKDYLCGKYDIAKFETKKNKSQLEQDIDVEKYSKVFNENKVADGEEW